MFAEMSKFRGGRKLALAFVAVAALVVSGLAWDGTHSFSGTGYQSYQETLTNATQGRYDVKASMTSGTGQAQSTIYLGQQQQVTATALTGQTDCQKANLTPDPTSNHLWLANANFSSTGTATSKGQDPQSKLSRLCPDGGGNGPENP